MLMDLFCVLIFNIQGYLCVVVIGTIPYCNKFFQISFSLKTETEVQLRRNNFPRVKQGLSKKLQRMLYKVNNYIKGCKTRYVLRVTVRILYDTNFS